MVKKLGLLGGGMEIGMKRKTVSDRVPKIPDYDNEICLQKWIFEMIKTYFLSCLYL